MDGRNSGHMVQGHVDNVGEIIETWPDQESRFFKVFLTCQCDVTQATR